MSLTFETLLEGAAGILRRKLPLLAARVFIDRQWPVGPDAGTCIILTSGPASYETTSGRGGHPEFAVTGTFGVSIRVQGRNEDAIRAAVGPISEAVLAALLAQPDGLLDLEGFEQVMRITRGTAYSTEADRVEGQVSLAFDCGWQQEYPPATVDLLRLRVVLDAIDPADPLGPYAGVPPFPAPAAPPRPRGPDGRAETGLDITLPQ